MTKQFNRSAKNKVFGGVAGGLGEYFDVDPIIIRVILIVSLFAWGLSFFIYIGLWIFVPLSENAESFSYINTEPEISGVDNEEFGHSENSNYSKRKVTAGILLILFGLIILIDNIFPIDLMYLWPIVLVGLGAYLIYNAIQKDRIRI